MSDEEEPTAEAVKEPTAEPVEEPKAITFAEFLEDVPTSQYRKVTRVTNGNWYTSGGGRRYALLSTPELQLHCPNANCNGPRFFRYNEEAQPRVRERTTLLYLTYRCDNCKRSIKTFALYVEPDPNIPGTGTCYKIGELPTYGPPTPTRLLKLFGDERETFLKGRRCENQGLGIGAFAYYRRVVENQKNRILDEVIRVCAKIGAPADMIKALEEAKNETQFSRAMDNVKDAIPQALLIDGHHNPLTLLHTALSRGLHAHTDEQCLELAHDVRVVLAELAERLGQALKDEAELNSAVTGLLNPKQE
jgi:hypothetical protein